MKPERTKEEILQDLILVNTSLYSEDVILEMLTSIPPEGCKQIILAAMEEYRQSSPVESKWVSVKERLPEEGIEVLVWSDRYGRTFATLAGKNGYGHFWKYAGDPIVTFNAPTHWQPLPELPPIEETKEKI